jgi:hypothetical protein
LFDINLKLDNNNNFIINYSYLSNIHIYNDTLNTIVGNCLNILKYDSNFNLIFKKQISGSGNEGIGNNGVAIDEFDNIYLTVNFGIQGVTNYQYVIGNDTLLSNSGDALIVKIDAMGNKKKATKYGGLGVDGFSNMVYNNGHLYMIGVTNVYSTILNNLNLNFPVNYISRNYIAKLDTNGYCIWARKFGANDQIANLNPTSLSVKNNRIYITGHAFSNNQNTFLFEGGGHFNWFGPT